MKTRTSKAEADKAVRFIEDYLAHTKARWAGQPFKLAPWQDKIVRHIFGQQVFDDELQTWVRRIRTVYEEIPRKNGKSEVGAAIALYLLFADREKGAEIYSVAEDVEQANIVFNVARAMVEANPELSTRAKVYRRLIELQSSGNIYRVLPGDAPGAHGLNVHGLIFDELHTQKTRELWDVLTSAQGTRAQPLTWAFTTAGTDRASICFEQHDYGEKVARGLVEDPSFHYIRFGLTEGDDWEDEKVWQRCNPALGDFLSLGFLRSEYAKAKASPARQNTFRNLYLNEWTQQVTRYIDLGLWDASADHVLEPDLKTKTCGGGLYIGASTAVASWVLAFPEGDSVKVIPRFFVPRAALVPGRGDGDLYMEWERNGWLTVTEGETVDYAAIREQILKDAGSFDLQTLNISVIYRGSGLSQELVDYFGEERVLWFRPTHPGYAFATREFERLLGAGNLHHGGHPILRHMADSVVVRRNADGDVKPDTEASQHSIAGIVAMLMALDAALGQPGEAEPMIGWA